MTKRIALVMVLLIVAVVLAGCPQQDNQPEEPNNEGQEPTGQEDVDTAGIIVGQWLESGHANAIGADDPASAPGMRAGCAYCHNGYAFEQNAQDDLEGIGILKGTTCDACHIEHGLEITEAGQVENALGTIDGGTGSLCIACHFGRGKEPDQSSAPHHSVQTDMLFAKSGAEVEGVDYGSSPHSAASNTCLACHMASDDNNIRDHVFQLNEENVDKSCGGCHDFDSFNPTAKDDYDGDGDTEGIQDEVSGLMTLLEEAINSELNGGTFTSSHGGIVWQDADGNESETPPSPELYNAAWNRFFAEYDGSRGIHNPIYAVQLLQQSYKQLTGNDVPNATMR